MAGKLECVVLGSIQRKSKRTKKAVWSFKAMTKFLFELIFFISSFDVNMPKKLVVKSRRTEKIEK